MTRQDELPTTGDMVSEILDLTTGLGVMLMPALLLAVPGLILLVPLALLALPLVILAAPFVLVHYVRRMLRRPRTPSSQTSVRRQRDRAAAAA